MIFLDTGLLFALFVEGDKQHKQACEVLDEYEGRQLADVFLTTNHIVSETVTLLKTKGHPDPKVRHDLAVSVGQQLLSGRLGKLHHVTEDEEAAALEYLERHEDQDYSFVDCTSFVLMEKLGIRRALSVDKHFTHRFIAIPGPFPK